MSDFCLIRIGAIRRKYIKSRSITRDCQCKMGLQMAGICDAIIISSNF